MALAKWSALQSADTAVAAATLNALASGTAAANFALGSTIDNGGSGTRWLYADFRLVLRDGTPADATVTTGTGAPFLAIYILPQLDGTRFPTTNGAATAGPTSIQYLAATIVVPASTAVGVLDARGIVLPPCPFRVMINNQLGVALPSNNNAICSLFRYTEESA